MTVSMRVMSAGDGYKYLLKTVAAADGDRPLSTPLTRYYMEEGTPPGRWLGAGVAALGKGEIQVGDRVSEHQLQLLMGTGHDPITDQPLGRAFPTYKSQETRIEARIADLEPTMTPGAKGEAVAQIEARLAEARKAEAQMAETVAQLKADNAKRLQELEAIKTQAQRLEQRVDAARNDAGTARAGIDGCGDLITRGIGMADRHQHARVGRSSNYGNRLVVLRRDGEQLDPAAGSILPLLKLCQ